MKNTLNRLMTGITCTALIFTLNLPAHAVEAPAQDTAATQTTPLESTLTNGKPVTEENVLELLRQIEQDWPT
ncbi:MAG: hypothetical protein K2N78_01530, partial [Oscillospiraceae bacterium]|nr:hypothetical protein [Oscillospiraceae bacterium]